MQVQRTRLQGFRIKTGKRKGRVLSLRCSKSLRNSPEKDTASLLIHWEKNQKNSSIGYQDISPLCCVAQSCLTLWDAVNCDPPGSVVHGIILARILDWVAISYSRGIFLTRGSNPCLLGFLHWQADSFPTESPGKPIHLSTPCQKYILPSLLFIWHVHVSSKG